MTPKQKKIGSLALAFVAGVVAASTISTGEAASAAEDVAVPDVVYEEKIVEVEKVVEVHSFPEECHAIFDHAMTIADMNQGFEQWEGTVRKIMDDVQVIAAGTKFKDALTLKGDLTNLKRDFGGVFIKNAEQRFLMEQAMEACDAELE